MSLTPLRDPSLLLGSFCNSALMKCLTIKLTCHPPPHTHKHKYDSVTYFPMTSILKSLLLPQHVCLLPSASQFLCLKLPWRVVVPRKDSGFWALSWRGKFHVLCWFSVLSPLSRRLCFFTWIFEDNVWLWIPIYKIVEKTPQHLTLHIVSVPAQPQLSDKNEWGHNLVSVTTKCQTITFIMNSSDNLPWLLLALISSW